MSKRKAAADRVRVRTTSKHEFTQDEWKSKTAELTEKMKSVELEEEAVKAQAATARAQIRRKKAEVNDLANQLRNGYEVREVDAHVEFNPRKGTKRLYHFAPGQPHNGDLIREEAMTEADKQALLPLEESERTAPKGGDYADGRPGESPGDAGAEAPK